jgi:drug/metabolite transporter (DMT)-like permease
VLAGIVFAVLASLAYEAGYVLQAYAARAAPPAVASPGMLARLLRQRAFVAGSLLGIGGFCLQVLALRHAPLAVVQPILALGLIALLGFATVVLGERPGRRELAGVLVVTVGAALVFAVAPTAHGHPGGAAPYVLGALVLVVAAPFAVRARPGWALVASVAAADVVVALAGARLGAHHGLALGWLLLAAAAALAAVTAESVALQRLPAVRVGPVVLAAQAVVPVLLAQAVAGERLPTGTDLVVLAAGLTALAAGVVLLASSQELAAVMAAPH